MADEILKRDSNRITVLGGITDDSNQEIRMLRVDPVTGALKIVDSGATGGDVFGPATNTADYIPQWNGANSKTLKDGLAVPAGGLAGITALNLKAPLASPVFTGNVSISNAMALGTQLIATTGGTTTFTVASPVYTVFTGVQGQTLVLPNATTLLVGQRYMIDNGSTQEVVIQTNGGAELWRVAAGTDVYLQCLTIGTAAGTWEVDYAGTRVATGKKLTVSNTLTIAGTDGTTMTFPSTSATIARTDAANTFTGVQTMTSPALTTPAISGISTGTGVATAATVNTLSLRDANGNISTVNLIEGFRTQATAGGTTTLVVGDAYQQVFTGSAVQTVLLPTTSIVAGQSYQIINNSTLAVTVQSSGANTIVILAAGTFGIFTALVATPTTTANWNYWYEGVSIASGKKLTVNNTITLAGTDASTYTFPGATKTIAANDGSNLTLPSQAIGDLAYATSTTAYGRLAAVATGQVLVSAGTGTAPAYSATPLVSNLIEGFTTTATAAGTTTMAVTDKFQQYWTGSTTQTVKLPTTSVLQGQQWSITNQSTGNVTVQSSGANQILILGAGMSATFTSLVATPTTAANWSYSLISGSDVMNDITATANAATINLAYITNDVTNNSAATLTITLPTAGAVDSERRIVRIYDFSAVAQTIVWVNTENSVVTAPVISNGSTTLPVTVGVQYNGGTNKWRVIASA